MVRILIVLAVLAGAAAAKGRVVITETHIEIPPPITFVGTSAQIAPTSWRAIDIIAQSLVGNPSIRRLEVRAYGADVPVDRVVLGQRRALAVVIALERRGVAPSRLRAVGYAAPDPGNNSASPVFLILDRAP